MPEEIDLSDDEEAALDAVWAEIGADVADTPPSVAGDEPEGEDDDTFRSQ
jgi:hypothetical protein